MNYFNRFDFVSATSVYSDDGVTVLRACDLAGEETSVTVLRDGEIVGHEIVPLLTPVGYDPDTGEIFVGVTMDSWLGIQSWHGIPIAGHPDSVPEGTVVKELMKAGKDYLVLTTLGDLYVSRGDRLDPYPLQVEGEVVSVSRVGEEVYFSIQTKDNKVLVVDERLDPLTSFQPHDLVRSVDVFTDNGKLAVGYTTVNGVSETFRVSRQGLALRDEDLVMSYNPLKGVYQRYDKTNLLTVEDDGNGKVTVNDDVLVDVDFYEIGLLSPQGDGKLMIITKDGEEVNVLLE